MANRVNNMKGGQSYLDSPKGAASKKKASQGEAKVGCIFFSHYQMIFLS